MIRSIACLLLLLLLAVPVQAARVINSVTLDGGATSTVTPGSTVTVSLTVTTSGTGSNDDWDSTSYTLNGVTTCVDTPNNNGDGTYTESFTVTAPAVTGSYTISFYAHRNANCNPGADSNNFSVNNGIVVSTGGGGSGCAAIFPDGVSSNSASGSINFGWTSRTTGSPDNVLETTNLIDNSGGVSCDGSACSQSGSAVSAISYSTFPGGSSVSVGFLGSQSIAPGDYGSISVGTFATLQLSAGDYTVSGNLSLGFASNLVVSGSGTARIYVNGTVTLSSQADANSPGSADQLVIFSNGNVSIGSPATANGFIYSNGTVTTNNGAVVTGAVSGSSVTLQSSSTVNYDSAALSAADFGSLCSSSPPVTPTPLLEYRFDETSWSGTSGEVVDASGNGYDGTATNGAFTDFTTPNPAIPGDPGTCRYGEFDGSNDYVAVPTSFPNLTGSFTITMWIYARDNTGDHRIFADDQSNSGGYALSLGDNTNGSLRFFNRSVNPVSVDTPTGTIALNTWYHIAAVHDASGNARQIYVNGVAQSLNGGGTTATYTGTWGTDSGPVSIGSETNASAESGSGFRFDGMIDEVRVYSSVLSQSQIDTIRLETHPCSLSVVDHYEITWSGSALTCEPISVTITGHDNTDAVVGPAAGTTINLSTSTSQGRWSNADTGSLTDNGNGDASYTFNGNTEVTLNFNHPTAGLVNFDINSGSAPNEGAGAEDPDVTFVDSGFRIVDGNDTPISAQISAKPSPNSGTQQLYLQAVRTDSNTMACTSAFAPGTSADIDLAVECVNPSTCIAGTNFSIDYITSGGNAAATLPAQDDSASPAYTSLAGMLFPTDSKTPITITYPEAGQLQLHSRYEVLDGSGAGTGTYISGSSQFPVVPVGFCVEASSGSGDPVCAVPPAVSLDQCTVYVAAGVDFDLRVTAKAWEMNSDPDLCDTNATTLNYESSNVALTITNTLLQPNPIAPAGETAATLATPGATSTITSGTGELTESVSISEVGVFGLTATDNGYFGETIIGESDNVGRFTPDHFAVTSSSVVPAQTTVSGDFTYFGQPFEVNFVLEARSASGIKTSNYTGVFAKLDPATHEQIGSAGGEDILYGAVDLAASQSFNSLVQTSASGASWSNGELSVVMLSLSIDKPSPAVAPATDVDIGIFVEDSDGITFVPSLLVDPLNLDTSVSGSIDSLKIGDLSDRVIYGRVYVPPVYGPEIFAGDRTPVPFIIQYWDGGQFATFVDDSVTVYDGWTGLCSAGSISCSGVNFISATAGATVAGGLSDRANSIDVTRPGAGNVGTVFGEIVVDSWFQYDWSGSGEENPTTEIHFGRFRGHDRIIYWREVH